MKRLLCSTTALVGAGIMAGQASAADPIKLMVGGFFREAYMLNFDDDGEGELGNERNTDGLFNDAEIFFHGHDHARQRPHRGRQGGARGRG